MNIKELLESGVSPSEVIKQVKKASIYANKWEELQALYIPEMHKVVTDPSLRPKDKVKGGFKDVVAKITYSAEKIAVRKMNQMMFTIPVRREYKYDKTGADVEILTQIAGAIEKVYEKARINGVNLNRFRSYFAACEVATMWYAVKSKNTSYGFESEYKLRCRSYSPMDNRYSRIPQAKIYTTFDEYDDLVALCFEYERKEGEKTSYIFDVYTSESVYTFITLDGNTTVNEPSEVPIGKIQGAYWSSPMAIYEGIENNRNEIEFTLSRQSDVIRKNTAPMIKVVGKLSNGDKPAHDVAREVYQLENGGDLSVVAPVISTENSLSHIAEIRKNIEEETQLPNLSLENIKGLGVVSGEGRKTLLTDAHLKVGEEKHEIIWGLEREFEVIKAFLGQMNTSWEKYLPQVTAKHIITAFIQNDEDAKSKKLATEVGSGFKSRKTAIAQLNEVDDVDAELKQIQEEENATSINNTVEDVFTQGV